MHTAYLVLEVLICSAAFLKYVYLISSCLGEKNEDGEG